MKKIYLLYFLFISLAVVACSDNDNTGQIDEEVVPITVSPDSDLFGRIADQAGNAIAGVVVSDGYQSVLTDANGVYQMQRNVNSTFVAYTTPAQYKINMTYYNYPDFFSKIKAGEDNKFRKDFKLEKLATVENDFILLCIGDPQCNTKDLRRFAQETMGDIIKTVEKSPLPIYGLTLGDVVADEPAIFQAMRNIISAAKIPIFHTPGNHDKSSPDGKAAANADKYQDVFGPLNYSFDRGQVHIISMDNVIFTDKSTYKGGFTNEQVEWLKSDLEHVSKDKMIIFMYHIPIRSQSADNQQKILEMLKDFKEVHLMVGHTHYNENYIHTKLNNMYEHIHGAACGAWWHSNINGDGTPVGYAVYEVRGSSMSNWYYKSSLTDASDQMRLHRGNEITGGVFGEYAYTNSLLSGITITDNTVFANVWNADDNWSINLYEDGQDKGAMTLIVNGESAGKAVRDPWSVGYHIGVAGRGTPASQGGTGGSKDNYLINCKHLYYKEPSNPNAKLKVVAIDQWGNKYEQELFTAGKDYSTAIPAIY